MTRDWKDLVYIYLNMNKIFINVLSYLGRRQINQLKGLDSFALHDKQFNQP